MEYLNNSGIAYNISNSGAAEWAVFLHAAFLTAEMFDEQINYFEGKYNLIAVELIGHGMSQNAKKGSMSDMSVRIAEILEKHGVNKAHFVGVSLGAVIAQDFANRYAEKVASLTVVGGYDINDFDKDAQKENGKAHASMMLKALFSMKKFASANKAICAYTEKGQTAAYNMNLKFKRSSFRFMADIGKMVNRCKPTKRVYPLLIACGEHDIPTAIKIAEKWSEKEGAELKIFRNAGHCANLDAPDEFNRVLEEFWNRG